MLVLIRVQILALCLFGLSYFACYQAESETIVLPFTMFTLLRVNQIVLPVTIPNLITMTLKLPY